MRARLPSNVLHVKMLLKLSKEMPIFWRGWDQVIRIEMMSDEVSEEICGQKMCTEQSALSETWCIK